MCAFCVRLCTCETTASPIGLRARTCVRGGSLSVLNGVRGSEGSHWIERCYLTASSVPISKRIRQTFGDKLPLPAAATQEGASSESNDNHKTKQKQ